MIYIIKAYKFMKNIIFVPYVSSYETKLYCYLSVLIETKVCFVRIFLNRKTLLI